jgi:hypothetical protein
MAADRYPEKKLLFMITSTGLFMFSVILSTGRILVYGPLQGM